MRSSKENLVTPSQKVRRTVLALVTLFALFALTVAVASGEDVEQNPESSFGQAATTEVIRELPNRRTATSDTFLLSDGSLESRLYEVPVNYRDKDGDWKPIDEELTELPSGALVNGGNAFDLHLPEELEEAPVRIVLGDAWISEMPLGIQTSPAQLDEDGTASYATVGGSADLQFTGLANGLKETIELAGPAAPLTHRFEVDASAGVAPELLEDGSIAFRDQDDELVAQMPAPFMVDASDRFAPAGAVHYSLEENGGGPGSWLSMPTRNGSRPRTAAFRCPSTRRSKSNSRPSIV